MRNMKIILDAVKKSWLLLLGDGVVSIPLAILSCGYIIENIIIGHPLSTFIFVIILIVLLVACGIIIYRIINDVSDNKIYNDVSDNKKWKHSVLIVDDDIEYLGVLKDVIESRVAQNMVDVLCINSLPDVRLVKDFEIIISDVIDASGTNRHSTGVLKAIKDKYPYKIVRPMSTTPEVIPNANGLFDGDVISKPIAIDEKFINNLVGIIEESCHKLEKINNHWEETRIRLEQRNINKDEIEAKRKEYYSYITII